MCCCQVNHELNLPKQSADNIEGTQLDKRLIEMTDHRHDNSYTPQLEGVRWGVGAANAKLEAAGKKLNYSWEPEEKEKNPPGAELEHVTQLACAY